MGPASPAPCRSSKLGRIENRLWWIRLRGHARVLDDGEERTHALALLAAKYDQYSAEPPDGPVLAVDVTEVREWSA